jgi:nucleotide-binding universal stress UspA family protein
MQDIISRHIAYHENILKEAQRRIQELKPALTVSTKILQGRPAIMIVNEAKKVQADVIVIGSQGLGGIKEFFLGSISDRVADTAPCPVLIVK